MNFRNIAIGTVGTVVVLIFLIFVLRSCTRDSGSSSASLSGSLSSIDMEYMTECTPDPETGICFAEEKSLPDFDEDEFMEMVREHQKASSSSSSPRSDSSILDRLRGTRGSSVSTAVSPERSSSSISSVPVCIDLVTGEPCAMDGAMSGDEGSGGSGSGGSNDINSSGAGGDGSGTGGSGMSGDAGGSGNGGGAGDGNGSGSGGAGSGSGITVYGGLQGSMGTLPSGKCLRNRSLIGIFDEGEVTTGDGGWRFPVLIDGNCPVSAAILKWDRDGFGGTLSDF